MPAGNEQIVTDNTPQPSGLFGVYIQVGDLDRSLSFYRDVLALDELHGGEVEAGLGEEALPAAAGSVR